MCLWYYNLALAKRGLEKRSAKSALKPLYEGKNSTLKIKQRIGTQEIYLRIKSWEQNSIWTDTKLTHSVEKDEQEMLVCWKRLVHLERDVLIPFNREFDPGSGRTLAACLTHASRTKLLRWIDISLLKDFLVMLSGGRVSNAWATCLSEGDNSWKRLLIPHNIKFRHLYLIKGAIRWKMGSRPIR